MSAGYRCSENYHGAAPQSRNVRLCKLGDGTDISGLPETREPLWLLPLERSWKAKKTFSFLPNVLLININTAEGPGMMPSRDSLEIRSLL